MFKRLKNKYLWLFLLLVGGCITAMAVSSSGVGDNRSTAPVFRAIYSPVQKLSRDIRDQWDGFTGIFAAKKTLNNRIADLEKQVGNLKMKNQSLNEYREEALRLQKLLDFKNSNQEIYTLTAARVIARSPDNWYKNLVIDKGSSAGIALGMPVISPDGLVGRVSSISRDSARVDLITDREMAVGVFMEKNRDVTGIVEGLDNNNYLQMADIADNGKVQQDDLVITAGVSSVYPKGIPVGTVGELKRDPSGLLFTTRVKPAVDFSHLEEVLVIIDYRPAPEANQGTAG